MAVAAIKAKNTVESLRDIVQDLLVPELKSIKVEIEGLRTEMRLRDEKQTQVNNALRSELDSFRTEIRSSQDSLRNEMTSGFEALRTEMQIRDEKQTNSHQASRTNWASSSRSANASPFSKTAQSAAKLRQ